MKTTYKEKPQEQSCVDWKDQRVVKEVRAFELCTGFVHNMFVFWFCRFILDLNKSENLTFDVKKVFERERAPQYPLIDPIEPTVKPKTKRVKIPIHKIKNLQKT